MIGWILSLIFVDKKEHGKWVRRMYGTVLFLMRTINESHGTFNWSGFHFDVGPFDYRKRVTEILIYNWYCLNKISI